jgi:hypothetical protein
VGLVLQGRVTTRERIYAFDHLGQFRRTGSVCVCRVRGRLLVQATTPGSVAIAEAILELQGGSLLIAGAVADTVDDAVDQLVVRLRRRIDDRVARPGASDRVPSATTRRSAAAA